MSDARPVGIFDSGVGGLTVAGEFTRALPHEAIVYLGDTARVPYGSKSADVVRRYADRCAAFLLAKDIKLLIVACNTASAVALDHLAERLPVPVLGVIGPGAAAAVAATRTARIGVIGTIGTIGSGAYRRAILAARPDAVLVERACPLLVPLAEEGWTGREATRLIVSEYLAPLREGRVDTLVLGCTHYPVLAEVIAREMGPGVVLCDSASAVTESARELLVSREKLAPHDALAGPGTGARASASHRFFLTDDQPSFQSLARRFFGSEVEPAERVDL